MASCLNPHYQGGITFRESIRHEKYVCRPVVPQLGSAAAGGVSTEAAIVHIPHRRTLEPRTATAVRGTMAGAHREQARPEPALSAGRGRTLTVKLDCGGGSSTPNEMRKRKLTEQVVEFARAHLDLDHPSCATSLNRLAALYRTMGLRAGQAAVSAGVRDLGARFGRQAWRRSCGSMTRRERRGGQ